jgi:hypothetical protein
MKQCWITYIKNSKKSPFTNPITYGHPDPHWPKILDPHWNQFGSTTLVHKIKSLDTVEVHNYLFNMNFQEKNTLIHIKCNKLHLIICSSSSYYMYSILWFQIAERYLGILVVLPYLLNVLENTRFSKKKEMMSNFEKLHCLPFCLFAILCIFVSSLFPESMHLHCFYHIYN